MKIPILKLGKQKEEEPVLVFDEYLDYDDGQWVQSSLKASEFSNVHELPVTTYCKHRYFIMGEPHNDKVFIRRIKK